MFNLDFNASHILSGNLNSNLNDSNIKENVFFSNRIISKNASFINKTNSLNNTGFKNNPNMNIEKNKLKNTNLLSNSQILFNLNSESFMKRGTNLQIIKENLNKGKDQACIFNFLKPF